MNGFPTTNEVIPNKSKTGNELPYYERGYLQFESGQHSSAQEV